MTITPHLSVLAEPDERILAVKETRTIEETTFDTLTRSAGTDTTTMPANLPASSAIWLCSQFPPWLVTTLASASTRPERSSPMTVSTSRGMLAS